jgi:hypothetical protein
MAFYNHMAKAPYASKSVDPGLAAVKDAIDFTLHKHMEETLNTCDDKPKSTSHGVKFKPKKSKPKKLKKDFFL